MMTICYFGIYDPNYSRNRILIKGLRQNNVKVLICSSRKYGLRKYFDLYHRHNQLKHKYDIMIVGFPANQATIFAKFITAKPVIFDAYVSLYNAIVIDRQRYSKTSLKAKYFWLLDWLAFRMADKILADTREHINYFSQTFKIKKDKFIRVLIGADDSIFYPLKTDYLKQKKEFLVVFHGMFIPVQGIQYILQAAKILETHPADIKFQLIGSGQEYGKMQELAKELNLKNVDFTGRLDYSHLVKYLDKADVILGNFGDTDKTKRVIANKSYETLALGKPHISADVPAMHELFTDRENILFCKRADPQDLADKIIEIKNNHQLRNKIAQNGYELFKRIGTPKIISRELLNQITHYLKNNQ
jgi:glycosyltransferase involved in cell wall biosynthesis